MAEPIALAMDPKVRPADVRRGSQDDAGQAGFEAMLSQQTRPDPQHRDTRSAGDGAASRAPDRSAGDDAAERSGEARSPHRAAGDRAGRQATESEDGARTGAARQAGPGAGRDTADASARSRTRPGSAPAQGSASASHASSTGKARGDGDALLPDAARPGHAASADTLRAAAKPVSDAARPAQVGTLANQGPPSAAAATAAPPATPQTPTRPDASAAAPAAAPGARTSTPPPASDPAHGGGASATGSARREGIVTQFAGQRVSVSVTDDGATRSPEHARTPAAPGTIGADSRPRLSGETVLAAQTGQIRAQVAAGREAAASGGRTSASGEGGSAKDAGGEARHAATRTAERAETLGEAANARTTETAAKASRSPAQAAGDAPAATNQAETAGRSVRTPAAHGMTQGFDPVMQGTQGAGAGAGAADAANAAGRSADGQPAAPARPAAPAQAPHEQVAVQIQRAVAQGQQRLNIRLSPADLGRIDVKLELGDDGTVRAVLAVDKPDTLDLLQRDARGLERALQNAGLKTDGGSLNFNLRGDQGNQGGQPHEQPAFANLAGTSSQHSEGTRLPESAADIPRSLRLSDDGLDIRV